MATITINSYDKSKQINKITEHTHSSKDSPINDESFYATLTAWNLAVKNQECPSNISKLGLKAMSEFEKNNFEASARSMELMHEINRNMVGRVK